MARVEESQLNNETPMPTRSGVSAIGTSNQNSGGTAATNSTYGVGAYTSGIAAQSGTSYTVQNTDYQGIIQFNTASPVTVMLNSAVNPNFSCDILNFETGAITLQTTDGSAINQGGSTLTLASGQGVTVYYANRSWTAYVGSTVIPVVPANTPAVAHEWLNSYSSTTGLFTQTQPGFSDIFGTLAASQLPAGVPVVSFGTGAPSGSSTAGYLYFDTSASPYQGYVFNAGTWNKFS